MTPDELLDDINNLLFWAWRYDDKPGRLYVEVKALAEKYGDDPKDVAEIERLMDKRLAALEEEA